MLHSLHESLNFILTYCKSQKSAWQTINPTALQNLVSSMPEYIKSVIEKDSNYINI